MPKVIFFVNKRKLGQIETNLLSFFLKRWIESPRKAVPIIKINSLIPQIDKKATINPEIIIWGVVTYVIHKQQ